MILDNESMKSNTIIERMIKETTTEGMDWIFLGVGMDESGKKNIFMSFVNLYGAKNLIIEVLMYRDKHKNKILIYMENSKTNEQIPLKDIKFNKNIMRLCLSVLESVKEYLDDEDFLEIYKELKPLYKEEYNFNDFLNYEEDEEDDFEDENKISNKLVDVDAIQNSYSDYEDEIIKLLYKRGDKKYWDNYIKNYLFDQYVMNGWESKKIPKEVVSEIFSDHDLN